MINPRSRQVSGADTVLLGADVVTLTRRQPRARAVAIRNGRILAVGGDEELRDLIAPSTRIIACQGACLLPSFHDAHIHLLGWASTHLSADCGPGAVSSIADIQGVIRAHAQTLPPRSWIRAGDYDQSALAERRHPTRWDLDIGRVTPACSTRGPCIWPGSTPPLCPRPARASRLTR